MRFQLISDIHNEFLRGKIYTKIVPKCSTLVLAGDIGNPMLESYGMFLRKMTGDFENVVLIHGNHEYYGTNYKDAVAKTREICAEINAFKETMHTSKGKIHFLHNSHVDIKGVRFIGSTLWSKTIPPMVGHLSKTHPDAPFMGDSHIKDMNAEWRNTMYDECREYLRAAIQELPAGKKAVIVTHHLPSFSLIAPKYLRYGAMNQLFASDCDDLVALASAQGVKTWVYGHTHDPANAVLHGVNMICNPVGYPGEREVKVSVTDCPTGLENGDTTVVVKV